MAGKSETTLSRRERQIMDIIYARGPCSAAQVHQELRDPPSYSAVRALIRILENKGHLKHSTVGNKYIYVATRPRQAAGKSAAKRLLETFFGGSTEAAFAALLEVSPKRSEQELDRLAKLIDQARKEGR